jgi:N4-gp56 family major capsid protein
MIVKQLGSAGTADPLNQRATQGWKATHVAEILSDLFMVRVEHTTPYERGEN